MKHELLVENAPSYQHLHHLVGSLQYLVDSDVPQKLFNRIIFQIAVASMHLKGLVDNLEFDWWEIMTCEYELNCDLTSKQLSVANSLAMEQSCTVSGCWLSRALAAFLTMDREATTCVAILASPNWLCWVSDRGWPNCFLTLRCSAAIWRLCCAAPREVLATKVRDCDRYKVTLLNSTYVDATSIKTSHSNIKALTLLANNVCHGDLTVLHDDSSGGLRVPTHLLLQFTKA